MEGHHLDPRLRGLPELLLQLLVQRAELAAVHILAAELAGCSPAVLEQSNLPGHLQDCQFSCREAEECQP